MIRVRIFDMPDNTWVSESTSRIKLYAQEFYAILPGQMRKIYFGKMKYEFNEQVVGVPYFDTRINRNLKLYYPEGSFKWRGNKVATVALENTSKTSTITIGLGQYICSIYLMTTQFFNLMSRHDNSDKGLRSAQIKIELINGKDQVMQ